MNEVLVSSFSVKSLLEYIEKIEICDIILEDVVGEQFEAYMTFTETNKPVENESSNPENIEKDEKEEQIVLYFKILGFLLRFHPKYGRRVLLEYPNFIKLATLLFLPVERKRPAHPTLLTCLIVLLGIPSLVREDIHIRNQIFLSRCSYNLLYHVSDIRLNELLIRTIVLITTKLGHEELDRSVQHPFFKNFLSYFLSQIHTSNSDELSERLFYLGMFFNSSKLVKSFCVVGDGRRLVEFLLEIIRSKFNENKKVFLLSNQRTGNDDDMDEKDLKIIRLVELTISSLVDILESPACPRKELTNGEDLGQMVKHICTGMAQNVTMNSVIRDGCQLILEVLEEICDDDDDYYSTEEEEEKEENSKRSEEEEKYNQDWLKEFEILEEEEKKRMATESLRNRQKIIEEDNKKQEKVREEEEKEIKEQDQIHETERDLRRTEYWDRLGKRADRDWARELNEREAWMREVHDRQRREEESKNRRLLERDRMKILLGNLKIDLLKFGEIEKESARERLRIRWEEEARKRKEARIRELENARPSMMMMNDLRDQVMIRRDAGFESVPTPLTPLSPGGAFSRSHVQKSYEEETTGMFRDYNQKVETEEKSKKQQPLSQQNQRKFKNTYQPQPKNVNLKKKKRGSFLSRGNKKKKKKKKGGAIDMSLRGATDGGKDEEKCSIM